MPILKYRKCCSYEFPGDHSAEATFSITDGVASDFFMVVELPAS